MFSSGMFREEGMMEQKKQESKHALDIKLEKNRFSYSSEIFYLTIVGKENVQTIHIQ